MGNIRRSRGYSNENEQVKYISSFMNFRAKRLGGSSVQFPDVVVTNDKFSLLMAMECKATGSKNRLEICNFGKKQQINTCIDCVETFTLYRTRLIVGQFKFQTNMTKSKLPYRYYVVIDGRYLAPDMISKIICHINGDVTLYMNDTIFKLKVNTMQIFRELNLKIAVFDSVYFELFIHEINANACRFSFSHNVDDDKHEKLDKWGLEKVL